jgi:hypothetical protein
MWALGPNVLAERALEEATSLKPRGKPSGSSILLDVWLREGQAVESITPNVEGVSVASVFCCFPWSGLGPWLWPLSLLQRQV